MKTALLLITLGILPLSACQQAPCAAVPVPAIGTADYQADTWTGPDGSVIGFSREEDSTIYRNINCI
jgi:hypothetical protein